ncbi:TetR family transcriptional regulator [Acuticoccus sediminis]|uniref:TetR family transcriptional regulator n=1 Tax=Acuticoccus sediminis TaxID=2184697 RepID=UPI001CFDDC9B|nr:TetR family transcriptional regulator [Acuticoccus sediminis]
MAHDHVTANRLIAAAERVICRARVFGDVTVRRIAAEAEVNPSAIAYHFGSLEKLTAAVGARIYRRLNAERVDELQRAVDRARPQPPGIDGLVAALVGPSIRWSLDPASAYPVLTYMNRLALMADTPDSYREMIENVEHHRIFIRYLREAAPWYDEVEIGWRLNAALGVRTQVIRSRRRTAALTGGAIDLDDADTVVRHLVSVIAPMFGPPR